MRRWKHTVKGIGNLLEAFEPGQDSSAENVHAIHAILAKQPCFGEFIWLGDMEDFTDDGDCDDDMERANELLEAMYDYADANDIWIEPRCRG